MLLMTQGPIVLEEPLLIFKPILLLRRILIYCFVLNSLGLILSHIVFGSLGFILRHIEILAISLNSDWAKWVYVIPTIWAKETHKLEGSIKLEWIRQNLWQANAKWSFSALIRRVCQTSKLCKLPVKSKIFDPFSLGEGVSLTSRVSLAELVKRHDIFDCCANDSCKQL